MPGWLDKKVTVDKAAQQRARLAELDRRIAAMRTRCETHDPVRLGMLEADMEARKLASVPAKKPSPKKDPVLFPPAASLTVKGELQRMFQKGRVLHSNSHSPLRSRLLDEGLMAVENTEEGLFKCYTITTTGLAIIS